MSASINVKDIEAIIDSFVKKGVEYTVAFYPFIPSSYKERYENVIDTLRPAFGEKVAEKVYQEIAEAFKNIDLWRDVIVEGRKVTLENHLQNYILREDITRIVLNEVDKRFNQMPEEERKILSVACAIIDAIKNKNYPGITVGYPIYNGGISISSTDYENFSPLTSSVLGFEIHDVRTLFYKYLLGFQRDSSSHQYDYYKLEIYPFTISYIKSLALRVSNYIKIPNKFSISSVLEELYQRGEYVKLALIEDNLSAVRAESWLAGFSGKTYNQLCKEVVIEGIIRDCYVNPLVYEDVKEAIESLYNTALNNLIEIFRGVFEKHGYTMSRIAEHCTFTKPVARSIHIYLYPWPKNPHFIFEEVPGTVKTIIMQGIPTQSILNELQYYSNRGYLWLFIEKNRIAVVSNTYKHDAHYELLKMLKNYFSLEVIGPIPKDLEELITPVPAVPSTVVQPTLQAQVSPVKRFGSRDLLEDIVASVLIPLGFSVKVDHKIVGRAGTEIEVDVWGEKYVSDIKFAVYASCKNWDKPVEISVVREEFGRMLQLPLIPHIRVIVAPSFTEPARREAIADGFVVIETGERAVEDNLNKIYKSVYEKLNKLFTSVAPKWMQELAERARRVAEEIRRISEELEKAAEVSS